MSSSTFFNNFQSSMEQQLIEDLVTEAIRIYGMDIFYLPRTIVSRDDVFSEDDLSEYNKAVPMEMYIKNVDGFGGDGDFLSKFNIQIRDTITFSVSRRTFYEEMASNDSSQAPRPNEGDLIFFPLNKKIFKITFVEHEAIFYQMGSLQMWDLKCELFEYSNETLNTGIEDIDSVSWNYNLSSDNLMIVDEKRGQIVDETSMPILWSSEETQIEELDPLAQNQELETIADGIIDFSQIDPFSEGSTF